MISVTFPIARVENELCEPTKQEILRIIASIYGPRGILSPIFPWELRQIAKLGQSFSN